MILLRHKSVIKEEKGEKVMKSLLRKYGKYIAILSLIITAFNMNITCTFMAYQPQIPKNADHLRKIK